MIAGLIRWSAHNLFLVLIGTVFIVAAGIYSVAKTPLDAIPDLSDVQVIVYTEYPGQAPQVVEDQVTFPLTTAMLAYRIRRSCAASPCSACPSSTSSSRTAPTSTGRARACSNTSTSPRPPAAGVTPSLGPDATGVGWVYSTRSWSEGTLAELRTLQDWSIRYALTKAEGVAEVASIGGFVKTYAVTVDPRRLKAYGIPLSRVIEAIRQNNMRRRGPCRRDDGDRVRRSRPRLPARHGDLEQVVLKAEGADPGAACDVPASSWARTSAGAWPS